MARNNAYRISANPIDKDQMRTNTFEFVVTGIDNILRAGANETDADARITNASEILRFSVQTSTIPHFTQEVLTTRRGNKVIKSAGQISFGEGTINVLDYVSAGSKDVLLAWRNLSYVKEAGAVGMMKDYKKTCYLIEYTPDMTRVVRRWKIIGAWVSGISEPDYNMAQNENREVTATISYDEAYPEINDII